MATTYRVMWNMPPVRDRADPEVWWRAFSVVAVPLGPALEAVRAGWATPIDDLPTEGDQP